MVLACKAAQHLVPTTNCSVGVLYLFQGAGSGVMSPVSAESCEGGNDQVVAPCQLMQGPFPAIAPVSHPCIRTPSLKQPSQTDTDGMTTMARVPLVCIHVKGYSLP